MATLTVKNLPDDVYARLTSSAAASRRSINAEAIVRLEGSFSDDESDMGSHSTAPLLIGEGCDENMVDLDQSDRARSEIDELLQEARRWSRKDSDDTIAEALRAYIARMKRLSLLDLAGRIDFDPSYYYKAARRAR